MRSFPLSDVEKSLSRAVMPKTATVESIMSRVSFYSTPDTLIGVFTYLTIKLDAYNLSKMQFRCALALIGGMV
jgi:hypothetical protein